MRLPTFCKWAGVLAVCLAMAAMASAQYGGAGGMGEGGGTGGGSIDAPPLTEVGTVKVRLWSERDIEKASRR